MGDNVGEGASMEGWDEIGWNGVDPAVAGKRRDHDPVEWKREEHGDHHHGYPANCPRPMAKQREPPFYWLDRLCADCGLRECLCHL